MAIKYPVSYRKNTGFTAKTTADVNLV